MQQLCSRAKARHGQPKSCPQALPALPCHTQLHLHAQESNARINAIDFHRRTDLMVTSADDDAIRTYNMHTGVLEHTLFSRKYGAAHVCFTHHEGAVIYASSKVQARLLWFACSCKE